MPDDFGLAPVRYPRITTDQVRAYDEGSNPKGFIYADLNTSQYDGVAYARSEELSSKNYIENTLIANFLYRVAGLSGSRDIIAKRQLLEDILVDEERYLNINSLANCHRLIDGIEFGTRDQANHLKTALRRQLLWLVCDNEHLAGELSETITYLSRNVVNLINMHESVTNANKTTRAIPSNNDEAVRYLKNVLKVSARVFLPSYLRSLYGFTTLGLKPNNDAESTIKERVRDSFIPKSRTAGRVYDNEAYREAASGDALTFFYMLTNQRNNFNNYIDGINDLSVLRAHLNSLYVALNVLYRDNSFYLPDLAAIALYNDIFASNYEDSIPNPFANTSLATPYIEPDGGNQYDTRAAEYAYALIKNIRHAPEGQLIEVGDTEQILNEEYKLKLADFVDKYQHSMFLMVFALRDIYDEQRYRRDFILSVIPDIKNIDRKRTLEAEYARINTGNIAGLMTFKEKVDRWNTLNEQAVVIDNLFKQSNRQDATVAALYEEYKTADTRSELESIETRLNTRRAELAARAARLATERTEYDTVTPQNELRFPRKEYSLGLINPDLKNDIHTAMDTSDKNNPTTQTKETWSQVVDEYLLEVNKIADARIRKLLYLHSAHTTLKQGREQIQSILNKYLDDTGNYFNAQNQVYADKDKREVIANELRLLTLGTDFNAANFVFKHAQFDNVLTKAGAIPTAIATSTDATLAEKLRAVPDNQLDGLITWLVNTQQNLLNLASPQDVKAFTALHEKATAFGVIPGYTLPPITENTALEDLITVVNSIIDKSTLTDTEKQNLKNETSSAVSPTALVNLVKTLTLEVQRPVEERTGTPRNNSAGYGSAVRYPRTLEAVGTSPTVETANSIYENLDPTREQPRVNGKNNYVNALVEIGNIANRIPLNEVAQSIFMNIPYSDPNTLRTLAESTLTKLKTDSRLYLSGTGNFVNVEPYPREVKVEALRNELKLLNIGTSEATNRLFTRYTASVATPLHPAVERNDNLNSIQDDEIETLRQWIVSVRERQQALPFQSDVQAIEVINRKGVEFRQTDELSTAINSVTRQTLLNKIDNIIDNSTVNNTAKATLKRQVATKHSPKEMLDVIEDLSYFDPVEDENRRITNRVLEKLDRIVGDVRKDPLKLEWDRLFSAQPFDRSAMIELERKVDDRINGNNIYTEIVRLMDDVGHLDPVVTTAKERIPNADVVALNRIRTDLVNRRREQVEAEERRRREEEIANKRRQLLDLVERVRDLEIKGNFIVEINDATTLTELQTVENKINTEITLNDLRTNVVAAIFRLPDSEPLKSSLRNQERRAFSEAKLRDIKSKAEARLAELEDEARVRNTQPRTPVPVKPREPKVPIVKKFIYDEDVTGRNPANLIRNERHTITPENRTPQNVLIPAFAPFYRATLVVTDMHTGLPLQEGIDYTVEWPITWADADTEGYKALYLGIQFIDNEITGQFELQYQTLGGQWAIGSTEIAQALANQANDPLTTTYDNVLGRPIKLPPLEHVHSIHDFIGFGDLCAAVDKLTNTLAEVLQEDNSTHPGYNTLVDTYFRINDELTGLRNKIDSSLNSQLNTIAETLARFDDQVNVLRGEFRAADNDVTQGLTNRVTTLQTDMTAEIDRLRTLLNSSETTLRTEVNNLKQTVSGNVTAEINKVKEQIGTLQTTLGNNLQNAINTLTQSFNTYKGTNDGALNTLRQTIDNNNTNLTRRVSTLEGKPANSITYANNRLTYNNKKYMNEDDLASVRNELNTLKTNLGNTTANTISGLQTSINGLTTRMTAAETANRDVSNRVTTINNTVTSYGSRLSTLEGKVRTLEGQYTTLNNNYNTLNGKYTDLERRVRANEDWRNAITFEY